MSASTRKIFFLLLSFAQKNNLWPWAMMTQSLLRSIGPSGLTKRPVLKRCYQNALIPRHFSRLETVKAGSFDSVKLSLSLSDESDAKTRIGYKPNQQKGQLQLSDIVEKLFRSNDVKHVKINQYWLDPLKRLSKHQARALVPQLNPSCPLGFDPLATPSINITSDDDGMDATNVVATATKKGSLLEYAREQKKQYPECILLIRVGEFYEAYGIDAILLVEHCGLNPMGGKARAGCPVRNIQITLDRLTSEDYTVAVFEEAPDTDSGLGKTLAIGSKSRLKHRFLGSIVSPASPLYKYGRLLGESTDSDSMEASFRPYVGIISTAAGFTVMEISRDERVVRILDRLTPEAVACRLSAFPPVDPLFFLPYDDAMSTDTRLPFLPSRSDITLHGPGSRLRIQYLTLPPRQDKVGGVDVDIWKNFLLSELLKRPEIHDYNFNPRENSDSYGVLSPDDFLVVGEKSTGLSKPLSLETARQLGLMDDRTIPNIVNFVLPETAPVSTRRFVRRWLLTPPPPKVGDAMRCLVRYMVMSSLPLPPLVVPPIRTVLSLVRTEQASDSVFRDVYESLNSIVSVLNELKNSPELDSLMILITHECGVFVQPHDLRVRCVQAQTIISNVVAIFPNESIPKYDSRIPANYFRRNEELWRGKVKKDSVLSVYARVDKARQKLVTSVEKNFLGLVEHEQTPIVQDQHDNSFYLKEIPSWAVDKQLYINPHDRNRKIIRNRYTTKEVESAMAEYLDACECAAVAVQRTLSEVSKKLIHEGHLSTITQCAHGNLILSTVSNHAMQANRHGWNIADCIDYENNSNIEIAGQFRDIWPYWMRSSETVKNSFDLDGVFLLTAPNMSGKSTLMRATAAVALLTISGLAAPVGPNTWLRRFDHLFLRGASSDVPSENKSAFGAEMADIASMIRSSSRSSLVFVDEVGRGTSPLDGTSLAGSILENIATQGIFGFFATHLHGIFDLQFNDIGSKRIKRKRLSQDNPFVLTDGQCTDSLAFDTAAKFGLNGDIINRAKQFRQQLDDSISFDKPNIIRTPSEDIIIGKEIDPVALSAKKLPDDKALVKIDIIREIIEDTTGEEAIFVPCEWSPPAALEGISCLYVLVIDEGQRFYVGETDCISNRLRQHRRNKNRASAHVLLVKVSGGKTEARLHETTLIRRLSSEGYELESKADGRRK